MKLLGIEKLWAFIEEHPDSEKHIRALITEIKTSDWLTPHDIKNRYPKASIIKDGNVVFDICRNKYRVWIKFAYKNGIAVTIKVGTHKEYDKWEIK